MATHKEKTERRWRVIKYLFLALLLYTLGIVAIFMYKGSVEGLNHLTTVVFGLVTALGVGNWMTSPSKED